MRINGGKDTERKRHRKRDRGKETVEEREKPKDRGGRDI